MRKITGIIPAAGNALRISPIPCSKEIFPVGFHRDLSSKEKPRVKVAASYLLESYKEAGAELIYFMVRKEKWDIPQYYGSGDPSEYSIAYLVTEPTEGTPYTIDQAYRFVKDHIILFGFPDILFKPRNAFVSLLNKQKQTGAEVVLGLFEATNPQKVDMVDLDDQKRVKNIIIKPLKTELKYTWTIAAWTPVFSQYIHEFISTVDSNKSSKPKQEQMEEKEIFMGDVIQHFLEDGLKIETVLFPEGEYIDIGTVPDLKKVLNSEL